MIRDEKHTISNEANLAGSSVPAPASKPRRFRVPLWAIVLVVAIVLIALGVAQGDMLDTWRKASLICYECIGIG